MLHLLGQGRILGLRRLNTSTWCSLGTYSILRSVYRAKIESIIRVFWSVVEVFGRGENFSLHDKLRDVASSTLWLNGSTRQCLFTTSTQSARLGVTIWALGKSSRGCTLCYSIDYPTTLFDGRLPRLLGSKHRRHPTKEFSTGCSIQLVSQIIYIPMTGGRVCAKGR
jgi:hypothetical protein